MKLRWVVALSVVAGCRCQEGRLPDAGRAESAPDAVAAGPAGDGGDRDDPGEPPVEPTGPDVADEPPDPGAQIDALGAIPAWQAVVDRDAYLARRGAHAVVFGVVAAQPADLAWLIDDTEGGGALVIRVMFPSAPPTSGTRVAVRGAWKVDELRRWYWEGEAVTPLAGVVVPPTFAPGHAIAVADPPGGWSGVRTPDKAKDGDRVAFTVVEKPLREGDGWGAATERYGQLLAYVRLPGERPSYGGHDLRSADERWVLKTGATYWITAGKVRRREGQVPVIEAVTPPVRFP